MTIALSENNKEQEAELLRSLFFIIQFEPQFSTIQLCLINRSRDPREKLKNFLNALHSRKDTSLNTENAKLNPLSQEG